MSNTTTPKGKTEMTNYTTVKLTDNEVRALFYAINITQENFNNYDEWEMAEYGHNKKEAAFQAITAKFEKLGWR